MNDIKIAKDITSKDYGDESYIQRVLSSVKQKIDSPKINRNRR